jgi:[protein-PII] uridylyltransferase
LRLLEEGREFLWRIRFALHTWSRAAAKTACCSTTRCGVAKLFGYRDGNYMLAVEQFMQRYYRTVKELSRLNEMLLQRFQEVILMNPDAPPVAHQ